MSQAQNGDIVKVHYTGKLDDGTVFDSSIQRDPIEFKLGDDKIIPGLSNAVVGMIPGESKTVTLVAEQAYGPHRQDLVVVVNRAGIPDDVEIKIGAQLHLAGPDGKEFPVRVIETSEETLTLDSNHPLAGENLTFDIQLVEIS